MDILLMQVFVSLFLVVGSVLLFLFSAKQRDFDHADRLALLPIDEPPEGGGRPKAEPSRVTYPKEEPPSKDDQT